MDFKSVDLLNAIRNEASEDYKGRIPEATQETVARTGSAILNYQSTRNEFVSALLNRIAKVVIKNKLFENPLREFKNGVLEWGKDIEEVFVDIIKAESFDPDKAQDEVFKRNLPNISAVFHRVNREDMYKTTVSNEQLKRAFLSEDGFNNLIEKIVEALYTSDNFDEFILMKNLIHQYGKEGKFKIEVVPPAIDEVTAKACLKKIKAISNKITFMKSDYNYAGVTTHTPKKDQIILIDTDFDALVDVEVLASAFNMDKADFIGRRVLVDDFGGLANVLCAVVDKDWFMVYDKEFKTEEIYNPQGLYYNYFLHHWQTLSTSQFANAILFVTVAPTLTDIKLSPATATVPKTGSVQFVVEPVGTNNPPAKCKFTHNGTDSYISNSGLLVVGKNETKTTITVTAKSIFKDTIIKTATITVI